MEPPSRSRKRGFGDQLAAQMRNSEPGNTQRSKANLDYILAPIPAGDSAEQDMKRLMAAAQPHQEEELSGTLAQKFVSRQDSQAPFDGNTGQGIITSYHNTFAAPMSTSQEYRGLALARQLGSPAARMNHNSPDNSDRRARSWEMQDYRMQIMLLEQQNRNRLSMATTAPKGQDTALQKITLLLDQLNITHTSVKELLAKFPAYIQHFMSSVPRDINILQSYDEKLDQEEAEIKALENRYNELIQMTPEAQQGELRQVRDKVMLTMQQDREELRLDRYNAARIVEEESGRTGGLRVALMRSREVVEELIEDLMRLVPELRNLQMVSSNHTIGTVGENYEVDTS
ncbi:hypothetical protein B0O99DRAFT_747523 [Bisporella sp. PMI_857]|nr:hypothetical protein B0O99DRAFT_747523 [Bisporella sp. PMI_857]